jgi:hypothetical protein
MSDRDRVENPGSVAEARLDTSNGTGAPRWPNPAVVLEVLAALEEEFRSVLSRGDHRIG